MACSALEKTKYQPIEVYNLPLHWEGQDRLTGEIDTPAHREQWRAWLFAEFERAFAKYGYPENPPILVDMDPPYHVTQGGKVLFQRHDGRGYQEGDPLWLAQPRRTGSPSPRRRPEAARAGRRGCRWTSTGDTPGSEPRPPV